MTQAQTVTGFFDNVAEAQQAVQLLLGFGFTAEQVTMYTPTAPPATGNRNPSPTAEERNTGRFLTSLFGNRETTRPAKGSGSDSEEETSRQGFTQVRVGVQSGIEVDQATHLLKGAITVTRSKLNE